MAFIESFQVISGFVVGGYMKKKICFISPKSYPLFNSNISEVFGGAEVQMSILAKACAMDERFEVHALVADYGQASCEIIDSCFVWKGIDFKMSIPGQIFSFFKTLHKIDAEIYIQRTLTPYSGVIALLVTGFMKKKFVYMVAHDMETDQTHELCKKKLTSMMATSVYRFANRVVAQNATQCENLKKIYNPEVCQIFKKAIFFPHFFRKTEKEHDCIWVGRCEEWKKPEVFLDLCRRHPHFSFVMIAPAATGKQSYFLRIKKKADKLKNLKFHVFLPYKTAMEQIAASRLLCMTSSKEGDWPMVVLEAAALGVPVLSLHINHNGLIDEFGGGVCCNGDEEYFAAALERILGDQNKMFEMSIGANSYINHYHAYKKQTAKFKEILQAL